MKIILFLLLLLPCIALPQQTKFNLKGIKQLDFDLRDKNTLTENTYLKIKTDCKLKMKTAGIEFKDESPKFIISVNAVTSNSFLVWFKIVESFDLERDKQKIKSDVITYSQLNTFKYGLLEDYNKAVIKSIDEMLNEFIDQFLTDNQN